MHSFRIARAAAGAATRLTEAHRHALILIRPAGEAIESAVVEDAATFANLHRGVHLSLDVFAKLSFRV